MLMLKLILLSLWFSVHPVHVTLLSIEYSSEKNSFDAFLRVYYDDFLLDYKLHTGIPPDFDVNGRKTETIKSLYDYLRDKVQLISGDKKLDFKITDINLSDNELNINMQYPDAGKSKVYRVINSILTDIYNDQSNLLIFRYGDFEEGVKLTPGNREHLFDI